MKQMNRKEFYDAPACRRWQVEVSHLMDTSFTGQHHPGHHGVGPSSAKAAMEWEEEEEEESSEENGIGYRPWED